MFILKANQLHSNMTIPTCSQKWLLSSSLQLSYISPPITWRMRWRTNIYKGTRAPWQTQYIQGFRSSFPVFWKMHSKSKPRVILPTPAMLENWLSLFGSNSIKCTNPSWKLLFFFFFKLSRIQKSKNLSFDNNLWKVLSKFHSTILVLASASTVVNTS